MDHGQVAQSVPLPPIPMVMPLPVQPDKDLHLQSRRQVWSDYWQQGALHSLCGSLPDGLDGAIRDFWLAAFASCPRQGRMLDLCTGNGAIPKLACESGIARFERVDAIDLATLAPAWLATAPQACRQAIVFHGGIRAEDLPFEPGTFELITSQYGLEYCHLDQAVPELARIAKPGAGLALVVHHAGSRLFEVAREEASSIDWLLSADGPLPAAAAMYGYLAMAAAGQGGRLSGDQAAASARDRLNAVMQALVQRSEQSAYPDVLFEARDFIAGQIQALMQRTWTLEQTRYAHETWRGQLEAAAFRHRELCNHALDAAATLRLTGLLTREGFTDMSSQLLQQQSHLVGWRITATRQH